MRQAKSVHKPDQNHQNDPWQATDYEQRMAFRSKYRYLGPFARGYTGFKNRAVDLAQIATLVLIVFTLADTYYYPEWENKASAWYIRIACLSLMVIEMLIYYSRSPSLLAFGFRYLLDLLCIGAMLFCYIWEPLGYTHSASFESYIPLIRALPIIRFARLAAWAIEFIRGRGFSSYQEIYIYYQSIIVILTVSLAALLLATVYIDKHASNQEKQKIEEQPQKSSKAPAPPTSEELSKRHQELQSVSNPGPSHNRVSSFFTLLVAFVSGEVELRALLEHSHDVKFIIIVLIILGALIFAGTTATAPQLFRLYLRHLPIFTWHPKFLNNHIVVCGYSQSILSMIQDLAATPGFKDQIFFFVNEHNEPPYFSKLPLRYEQIYYLRGDFTQPDTLIKAGINRARYAIVVADQSRKPHPRGDRDMRAVFTALKIEHINDKIISITERLNSRHQDLLKARSIEAVINRNEISGRAMAIAAQFPSLSHVLLDLVIYKDGISLGLYPLTPQEKRLSGETLRTRLSKQHQVPIGWIDRRLVNNKFVPEYHLGTQLTEHISTATHLIVVSWQDHLGKGKRLPAEGAENTSKAISDIDKEAKVLFVGWNDACTYMITEIAKARKNGEFASDEIEIIVDENSPTPPQKIAHEIEDHLLKFGMPFSFEDTTDIRLHLVPVIELNEFEEDEVTVIRRVEGRQYTSYVANYKDSNYPLKITCKLRDYTDISNIRSELSEAGRIIIPSDRGDNPQRDRDARAVFMALAIYYCDYFQRKPHIVVELVDESYSKLFNKTDIEVVLRNQLSGGILATACRHPKLADILIDLLTITGGHRLDSFNRNERNRYENGDYNFQELADIYWKHDIILLGYENPQTEQPKKDYHRWVFYDPSKDLPVSANLVVLRKAAPYVPTITGRSILSQRNTPVRKKRPRTHVPVSYF